MRLFTHVLEELSLRGRGFSEGFMKDARLPKPTWPDEPRSVTVLKGQQFEAGKNIFKFGKRVHLEGALNEGSLRIAPASSYGDPSLNYAIRDDELSFTIEIHPQEIKVQKVDKQTLKPVGEIAVKGNLTMTMKCATDYWVFCLALTYPLRAYDDFETDACLVIRQPGLFYKRLLDAMRAKTGLDEAIIGAVDYLDPLNSKRGEVKPFFAKHFRYAYQKEIRVVWCPKSPVEKLQPLILTLGSLTHVAEILLP